MSAAAVEEGSDDTMILCASCGVAEGDDIKLKKCDDCDMVIRYCSDECQKEHRIQHNEECEEQAAELHDEILFKQPESSYLGDCPICCLPLPIDDQKSFLMTCCCKRFCDGCELANKIREIGLDLEEKCLFCRQALPSTYDENIQRLMKRVEAKDPAATREMGMDRYNEGDYRSAFEYWSKAAVLGDVVAHFQLSCLYFDGEGVEKDQKKELHHVEQAAIGGHPSARHNLGCEELKNGRTDRAVKHYIIAAKLGYDKSLKNLKNLYKAGFVSKEDFAATLRGHHAAIQATRSPQREQAAEFDKMRAENKTGAI